MSTSKDTRVNKILNWFKNNKFFSIIIVFAIVIIGLGEVFGALQTVKDFFAPEASPTATPSTLSVTPAPTSPPQSSDIFFDGSDMLMVWVIGILIDQHKRNPTLNAH